MAVKVGVARAWRRISHEIPLSRFKQISKALGIDGFRIDILKKYVCGESMRRDFKYSYRARQEILINLPVLFTRIIGHLQNLKSSAEFIRGPKKIHLSLVIFFAILHLGQQGRYSHEHTPAWNVVNESLCFYFLSQKFFLLQIFFLLGIFLMVIKKPGYERQFNGGV